jgi:hypothetical protein
MNPTKAPGYDFITNQILQKLSKMGIKYIIQLYNTVLRQGFFPPQWKIAQIIMIQKPDKSAELKLYTPINLLPVEKLLFPRISIIMESHGLIPDHQFGFRKKHASIEQIYRIVKRINNNIEANTA